ncbi:hypothetical protein MASR2M8_09910 [Opitutaceae bacterium]
MVYYVAAFSLLLHLLFWGSGLALLITPRVWRRYWLYFATACGLALQSAVVWLAANHTDLPGTLAYAKASLIIPATLLGCAIRVRGWPLVRDGFRKAAGVLAIMAVVLGGLMIPASSASKTLTSMSLGSCDAADYAAGARVLTEFSRHDRTGFMGLTEVVHLHSVDNFFDHWTRLNHFTPSALLALNNAVFGWEFYETVSVMAAVAVVAAIPLVFWAARTLFGFGPLSAGLLALLYGVNPVTLYSVWHVAIAQTLAATAIVLLTWCALDLWRHGVSRCRTWSRVGLLLVAYWLLLGSYNFILLVCLVPAVAFVGGQALWRRQWKRFAAWCLCILAPLMVAAVVFFERTAGLAERFLLFQEHDFGWRIPPLLIDGWLGLVKDIHLNRLDSPAGMLLAAAFALLLIAALIRSLRLGWTQAFFAVCTVVPIAVGYGFLQLRGMRLGTNASYDAYKLLAVFHPLILGSLCFWLSRPLLRQAAWRWLAAVAAAVVLVGNLKTAHQSALIMESPPLIVDRDLARVQEIESEPRITSVNMRIADFWTRLWSNAFLLRTPQYFANYTYEGRRDTELKGDWDLLGGLVQIHMPDRNDGQLIGARFSAIRTSSQHYLRTELGEGWFERESAPQSAPWRWTKGDSSLLVDNPHDYPLNVAVRLRGRSLVRRDIQLWRNGELLRRFNMPTETQTINVPAFELLPGRNVLEFRSSLPPTKPGPGDSRLLGMMVHAIDLIVMPRGSGIAR